MTHGRVHGVFYWLAYAGVARGQATENGVDWTDRGGMKLLTSGWDSAAGGCGN